ncbi:MULTISPECIES: hypothetical protein [unclassified Streptomyces]|uniref:hypothetical protein n=1 Tax=unclassified Streptomyces TaxID=2593676 RepID=UPI002259C062|nr:MULTISPECIES: hypothetical protein [unclassified Streptomyces]MCX4409804.1 hypothetical protein [Streptomyces sp. NBC_01764]MCX5191580.1 hypothetical protein [Streptomyces sp. NBC_00268]
MVSTAVTHPRQGRRRLLYEPGDSAGGRASGSHGERLRWRGSSPGVDEGARQRRRTARAQDAGRHRSAGCRSSCRTGSGDEAPALTAGLLDPKAPLAEEDVTIHSACAAVVMSRPIPRYRVPSRHPRP